VICGVCCDAGDGADVTTTVTVWGPEAVLTVPVKTVGVLDDCDVGVEPGRSDVDVELPLLLLGELALADAVVLVVVEVVVGPFCVGPLSVCWSGVVGGLVGALGFGALGLGAFGFGALGLGELGLGAL
jgi:hypothetical protein